MAYDKQSFLSMLAAGLVCKGTLAQKEPVIPDEPSVEPVAYLYNGVRLPKLPESELSYAMVYSKYDSETGNTVAYLLLSSTQFYYQQNGLFNTGLYPKTDGSAISYSYDWPDSNLVWSRNTEGDLTLTAGTRAMITTSNKILWANYDIENYTDGGVYFAKTESEEMPTYNADTAEWETLLETEHTVGDYSSAYGRGYYWTADANGLCNFYPGDVVRVTCNGVSFTGVATSWVGITGSYKYDAYVGNYGIYDASCPDDGGNVCVMSIDSRVIVAVHDFGTYEIKLERMVS